MKVFRTKLSTVLLALSLLAMLLSPEAAFAASTTKSLTLSGGAAGGGWSIYMTAIGEVWERTIPGITVTVVPGAGISNVISISRGQCDVSMTFNTTAHEAMEGRGSFDRKYDDIAGILNMNKPAIYHFPVLKRLGLTSLNDLAASKVAIRVDVGSRGSGGELGVQRILDAYGITYDDIRAWGGAVTFTSPNDAVGRLRDGHLDGIWTNATIGISWLLDLTHGQAKDITFLTLDAATVEALCQQYGFTPYTVPAGSYPGQDEPFMSVAEDAVIFVHKDMDSDLVYALTKAIWENIEHLQQVHPGFSGLDPEVGWQNLAIPLHPGAERYYREMGYIK